MSKKGTFERNATESDVDQRTAENTSKTPCGCKKCISYASHQENHSECEGSDLPEDLKLLVDAWDQLPEQMKTGIVAMVKSCLGV